MKQLFKWPFACVCIAALVVHGLVTVAEHHTQFAKQTYWTIGSKRAEVVTAEGPPERTYFGAKTATLDLSGDEYLIYNPATSVFGYLADGVNDSDAENTKLDYVCIDTKSGTVASYANRSGDLHIH